MLLFNKLFEKVFKTKTKIKSEARNIFDTSKNIIDETNKILENTKSKESTHQEICNIAIRHFDTI